MSKREFFMMLIYKDGPKTAQEIAAAMSTIPSKLSNDLRAAVTEKLLSRSREGDQILYTMTPKGREYCIRNYAAHARLPVFSPSSAKSQVVPREETAAPAVDGAADGDEPMTDAVESEGAAGGDQDVDVDSTIAEQAEPEAASHDAAESCDDFLLAIYGDPDGERTALELKANSNWAERATKLALETGQQVSVYRMKLVGRTRQQIVFEAA